MGCATDAPTPGCAAIRCGPWCGIPSASIRNWSRNTTVPSANALHPTGGVGGGPASRRLWTSDMSTLCDSTTSPTVVSMTNVGPTVLQKPSHRSPLFKAMLSRAAVSTMTWLLMPATKSNGISSRPSHACRHCSKSWPFVDSRRPGKISPLVNCSRRPFGTRCCCWATNNIAVWGFNVNHVPLAASR